MSTVPATTVDCGLPPPSPTNGHILPYTNTLNGAEVDYVCWNIHREENIYLSVQKSTLEQFAVRMVVGSLILRICASLVSRLLKGLGIRLDLCSIFSGQ